MKRCCCAGSIGSKWVLQGAAEPVFAPVASTSRSPYTSSQRASHCSQREFSSTRPFKALQYGRAERNRPSESTLFDPSVLYDQPQIHIDSSSPFGSFRAAALNDYYSLPADSFEQGLFDDRADGRDVHFDPLAIYLEASSIWLVWQQPTYSDPRIDARGTHEWAESAG